MSKVYVLYENADWLIPLERELKIAQLDYELWHVHQTAFDMSQVPPQGIYLNRMSPSSHTRGHLESVDITRELIYWLEAHGRRVINGSSAFSFEISKVKQMSFLNKMGLKTPKTIVATGSPQNLKDSARKIKTPFITKHNRGGKGMGVRLFQNYESFDSYVDSQDFEIPMDHITLIQEYIQPKTPQITRVEIVNQKFLYAINVSTALGFELCPAESCEIGNNFCPTTEQKDSSGINRQSLFSLNENFSDPIIEKYIALMKEHRIDIAGIEFIEDAQGNKITYDINCTTNYSPAVESDHHLNGMKAIVEFLIQELS